MNYRRGARPVRFATGPGTGDAQFASNSGDPLARRRAGVDSKILMLTARTRETDKVLGLDLGADDYVTKPYSPKELRARIRALLRRTPSETGAPNVVRFGDCEIDFDRAEVRRAGKLVATTPLEFKLFGLFAGRPGRVLTRRVLIDEVWGKETAITDIR